MSSPFLDSLSGRLTGERRLVDDYNVDFSKLVSVEKEVYINQPYGEVYEVAVKLGVRHVLTNRGKGTEEIEYAQRHTRQMISSLVYKETKEAAERLAKVLHQELRAMSPEVNKALMELFKSME